MVSCCDARLPVSSRHRVAYVFAEFYARVYLYFVVRLYDVAVKSSRSLSHLMMSVLLYQMLATVILRVVYKFSYLLS